MRLLAMRWRPWHARARTVRRELEGTARDAQERQAAFDRLGVVANKDRPDPRIDSFRVLRGRGPQPSEAAATGPVPVGPLTTFPCKEVHGGAPSPIQYS